VITETSSNDCDFRFIQNGMVIVPYAELVSTVNYYLKHEKERQTIQMFGQQLLRLTPFDIPGVSKTSVSNSKPQPDTIS